MAYDLGAMAARAKKRRRSSATMAPIIPTQIQADELAKIALQVVKVWADGAPAILDVYEASLRESRAAKDSPSEIDGQITTTEAEASRLIVTLTPAIRNWIVRFEQWHQRTFTRRALTATGISPATVMGSGATSETVDVFFNRILDLITKLNEETKGRTREVIWRAFTQRTPRREVAKELAQAIEISRRRALFIASDQTTKLSARLDQARQEEAGIDSYEWLKSGKVNPRPAHVARNGKVFRWDQPPPGGHPGTEPNCGCKARAHVVFEAEAG